MQIETSIFKAYDIRGIYPEQLNEDAAYALGRAYATIMQRENPGKKLHIAVGSDMRLSGPALKAKVIEGLADSGVDVDDIGLVSTPTFYFAVANYGYDGGLQVSASHNPKQWNGLKMVRRGAVPISKDSGINDMKTIVQQDAFAPLSAQRGVVAFRENIVSDEVADQIKYADVAKIKPFKIAIDGSNGMASVDMDSLFEKLACETIKMNFELDGTFPAHAPDPMIPENIADLCAKVVTEKCDLGIAPDGDGDRYFFVDEKGVPVPPYILRGLLAQIELQQNPGATIAYDIRPGRITRDMIEQFGGKPVVTPVGHSLIKEAMIREGAIFGGESSGHFFYKLPYGIFEMPMVLVVKFLQFLSEQGKPLSEVVRPFMRYAHSGEINIKLPSKEAGLAKIEEIKKRYADGDQVFTDGVTVEYPDFWFNLRTSNTEPLIRFTLEASNPEIMAQKRDEILELLGGERAGH